MSRYPVGWTSSKGIVVPLDDEEEMNAFRLVAAYHKLKRGEAPQVDGDARVCQALEDEMKRRGLDPAYKGGLPPQEQPGADDAKPPVEHACEHPMEQRTRRRDGSYCGACGEPLFGEFKPEEEAQS